MCRLGLPAQRRLRREVEAVITSDRSAVTSPPCPSCGASLHIDWADVTSFGKPPGSEYLPTGLTCPVNEDHDTRAAWLELDWPESLTEEDRAWLRQHANPAG